MSVLETITQSTVGLLTKRFGEYHLILISAIISALSFFGLALSFDITHLILLFIPFVFSAGILSTCITSFLTKSVKREDIGITLGVSDSLESISRVISPTVGGILFEFAGTQAPPLASATLQGLLVWMIYQYISPYDSLKKL